MIDGQFEAAIAVLLPLLNEGDINAIREVGECILNGLDVAEADAEEFSRLRFFEAVCQDERSEVRFLGKVWAAIIAGDQGGKPAAERWLPAKDPDQPKDLISDQLRWVATTERS